MVRRFACGCLGLVWLVAGCSTSAPVITSGDAVVYVIQRGWHTDIGLPVGEITAPLAVLEKPFPKVQFLTFGFGERQFVVNHEKNVIAMLNALLPSKSALLMTALGGTPEQAFGASNVVVLHITNSDLDRIEGVIWHELELSQAGEPVLLADGPYPGSVFFAARHTYYGLYTCNTWIADTLNTGGVPVPTTGVLFAGQVMGAVRRIETRQASVASLPGQLPPDDRRTVGK